MKDDAELIGVVRSVLAGGGMSKTALVEKVIAEAVRAVKGAPILIEEADENGAYAVGHPAQVTVYSPDNLGHRIYPSGVRQADWARDLPRLAQGEYR